MINCVILTPRNRYLNICLICNNKTTSQSDYKTICIGCLSLLFHPNQSCQVCGVSLQSEYHQCGQCQKNAPQYSSTSYAGSYQPPIDKWVMAFKFNQQIIYSRLFAETLLPQLSKIDSKYVLVPVPLHPSRLRKRGYNQAYEITIELAKLSGRAINTNLKRIKNTQMQAQLKLEQRTQNVKKAFKVIKPLKQKHFILIDDVMTSGNTLNECARTLRQNGAIDVKVMVFARKFL